MLKKKNENIFVCVSHRSKINELGDVRSINLDEMHGHCVCGRVGIDGLDLDISTFVLNIHYQLRRDGSEQQCKQHSTRRLPALLLAYHDVSWRKKKSVDVSKIPRKIKTSVCSHFAAWRQHVTMSARRWRTDQCTHRSSPESRI